MRTVVLKSLIASASSTLLIAGLSLAQISPARGDDVTIAISNIDEAGGTVFWSMFDSAAAFEEDGRPVFAAQVRVSGSELRATVHGLEPGRYAVKLFHDANGNGELDTNLVGIPTEGYGFSNNAGRRGVPGFDAAAVTVDGDVTIDIRVR